MTETRLSIFERIRIAMTEMVPVIRAMEAEFGEAPVKRVLKQKLEQDIETARAGPCRQPDFDRAQKTIDIFAEGGALDYEVLSKTDRLARFQRHPVSIQTAYGGAGRARSRSLSHL